jgi:hypothetical protein
MNIKLEYGEKYYLKEGYITVIEMDEAVVMLRRWAGNNFNILIRNKETGHVLYPDDWGHVEV